MKKYKKLLILLGILVVIIAAVIIITNVQKKKEEIKVSGEVILSVNEANASAISWTSEENNFSFHRGADGKWVYDIDEEFPVSQEEVEDIFDLFRRMTAAFVIENVTDFAQYGLKDPVSTVTITTTERAEDMFDKETQARGESQTPGELRTFQILVGAFSVMDEQRYVSIGDGNVYLVKIDPYEQLNVPESRMIQNDRIGYFQNIRTAEAETPEKSWKIVYDNGNWRDFSYVRDDTYYLEMDGKTLMLDPTVTLNYFSDLVNSSFENYVNYKVRDEELASYGLDKPELTLKVNTFTTNAETGVVTEKYFEFRISRDPEQIAQEGKELAEGEEAPEFKAYLRVNDSKIIYLLTEAQYNTLMGVTYNDLRYKKLMSADFGDIVAIDFTVDGETYTITSDVVDNVRTHYYDGNPLNMNNLKNALTAFTASEFTDEPFDGQEELEMVFHFDSVPYPTVTLTCVRKDGNQSLIYVDGEPQALVLRGRMNSLREALIKISLGNDVSETTTAAAD